MTSTRKGILAAGNFIVDHVKIIDAFPEQDTLVHILEECVSNGGGPYNVLKDLAALKVDYPLQACGLVGDDDHGKWILSDCTIHGIETNQLHTSASASTSYTDAMTVKKSGRRTFFHQSGTNDFFDSKCCDLENGKARIFYLGYLMLLARLDSFDATGRSEASRLLESASNSGMITAVDLVSADHSSYRPLVFSALPYIDHLFMNELEASRILGQSLQAEKPEILSFAAAKILANGVRQSVTIHTSKGSVCVSKEGETIIQPAIDLPPGFIVGATGAGDAFAAGFLHGIHEGFPLTHCLHLATCVAASSLNHSSPSGGILPTEECLTIGKKYGCGPFS